MEVSRFYDLISALKCSQSKEELESACLDFCRFVNTPWFLMGVISLRSFSTTPNINILSNYPEQWMKLYLKKNSQRTDPVVSYIIAKNAPIYWSHLMTLDQFKTAEQQLLMQEATKHGLVNGLSVPIHSVSGDIAVLSLAIDTEGEEGVKLLDYALPYANAFAMHLFERYILVLEDEHLVEKKVTLSERQKQCLFWACQGKTTWEISMILDIKERTVEFHLNNATKKLGASNRQHAVSIASKKGIILPSL
ncbi:helix-turn-helix transcriptional regulator [Sedimenticola sp.]|uniref:helix-turn-helix transcriptional regulator n=1 Tax=Sedimenticola sp. TaxID=1940285 RepID=UPI003D134961